MGSSRPLRLCAPTCAHMRARTRGEIGEQLLYGQHVLVNMRGALEMRGRQRSHPLHYSSRGVGRSALALSVAKSESGPDLPTTRALTKKKRRERQTTVCEAGESERSEDEPCLSRARGWQGPLRAGSAVKKVLLQLKDERK